MATHRASAEAQARCALRALTLCDGQVLEQPDHALASCLCWLEGRARSAGYRLVGDGCAEQRALFCRDAGVVVQALRLVTEEESSDSV